MCVSLCLKAFPSVQISSTVDGGIFSMIQSVGVGTLSPNTVLLGFYNEGFEFNFIKLGSSNSSNRDKSHKYVSTLREIIQLEKVLIVLKGIKQFPENNDKQIGTIDVYWIIHDGGILTLLAYLLQKHFVWKNCIIRVFAIAQLTDNSILMKTALINSLKYLRIEAECHICELGDYDISEFAYERTQILRDREVYGENENVYGINPQKNALGISFNISISCFW